jgi:hypothetical protein
LQRSIGCAPGLLQRVVVDRRSPHDSLAEMAKAVERVAAKYKR